MYVYKEVLSVWVREGRDICEFAQHRFIYKSSDNIIHDYISILVNICMLTRGSNCECVQGQEHMWYMKCGVLTATNFKASNSRSKNPARCTKSVFFSKIGSNWVSVTIYICVCKLTIIFHHIILKLSTLARYFSAVDSHLDSHRGLGSASLRNRSTRASSSSMLVMEGIRMPLDRLGRGALVMGPLGK